MKVASGVYVNDPSDSSRASHCRRYSRCHSRCPTLRALLQKCQDGGLLGREFGQSAFELSFHSPLKRSPQAAVEVSVDDGWMNVAFATDGLRVPQSLGDGFNGPDDVSFCLRRG